MSDWPEDQLERIGAAQELRIATRREDGTWSRSLPIWVVLVGDDVYVRTWHRRTTGWYGRAVGRGVARVEVPGVAAEVTVHDVGLGGPGLRADVDAAYGEKYADGAGSMVTDGSAGTTLRLDPR